MGDTMAQLEDELDEAVERIELLEALLRDDPLETLATEVVEELGAGGVDPRDFLDRTADAQERVLHAALGTTAREALAWLEEHWVPADALVNEVLTLATAGRGPHGANEDECVHALRVLRRPAFLARLGHEDLNAIAERCCFCVEGLDVLHAAPIAPTSGPSLVACVGMVPDHDQAAARHLVAIVTRFVLSRFAPGATNGVRTSKRVLDALLRRRRADGMRVVRALAAHDENARLEPLLVEYVQRADDATARSVEAYLQAVYDPCPRPLKRAREALQDVL